MAPRQHFSDSYRVAREAFVGAAAARGATVCGEAIPARDRLGDELSIDCAYLGPTAPASLLVVSSGVHGIEGFAGSAIQHRLLTEQIDGLALGPDTGLLNVHGVNPHGFSELRRVNESNVDLNRNFVRHPEDHVDNPHYEELFEAINPSSLDEASEATRRNTLSEFVQRQGAFALQEAISRGQYTHPDGVYFGGARQEASNLAIKRLVASENRGASRIAWIDIHTGLGDSGALEMITELPPDSGSYLRGRDWYGTRARSTAAGESLSAALHGVMQTGVAEVLGADRELTFFAAEFGTHDTIRVFRALRADNWLHIHGDVDGDAAPAIKDEIREVFCPDDGGWRQQVLDGGAEVIRAAALALSADG